MNRTLKESLERITQLMNESTESAAMEAADGVDTVKLDVPLMMRIMEFSREDAQTDMDLHHVVERMIELNKEKDHLSMDDYESIIEKAQAAPEDGYQSAEPATEGIGGLLGAAHLNRAFLVTAKTHEGETKRFRVKAQSERVAKEKFLKHHSMATILDVKEVEV